HINQPNHFASTGGGNQCLGCLTDSQHNSGNYNFDHTFNLTVGGTIIVKSINGGTQPCIVPSQGGEITLVGRGSEAKINLKTEQITERIIKNKTADPTGIPPATNLPIDPSQVNEPSATPFNPNQFP